MKDAEDEAFDELAKRQGMWGGGFQSKRAAAADKLVEDLAVYGTSWSKNGERIDPMSVYKEPAQEPVECLDCGSHNVGLPANYDSLVDSVKTQPAQEPVACERCKQLEEQAYDLLGQLKAANLKWSVAHPWVGLTDEERECIAEDYNLIGYKSPFKEIEAKLKEKNNGT